MRPPSFDMMASTCCNHFKPLATCTPNSLNTVMRSTGVPLRLKDGGRFLRTGPISSSFVFRPFTIMPASVACWTSSSTNDCMLLTADLPRTSVIVVSSMYLCIRQPGCSASIKMTNVSGPRYNPCGIPANSCSQSDRTSLIFMRCRKNAQIHLTMTSSRSNDMVDVIKRFGEVDKDRVYRLAIVDGGVPMVQHIGQCVRR